LLSSDGKDALGVQQCGSLFLPERVIPYIANPDVHDADWIFLFWVQGLDVYFRQMKKLLLTIFFVLAVCSVSIAQNTEPTNCPMISVTGPAGIVGVGELATYTATVGSEADSYPVEFVWTTSAGRIKEGQGTRSIKVIQPNACITVTVEIRGLSASCPSAASETACGHPPPVAEKFYELQEDQKADTLDVGLILGTLRDHPANQLYILAGDVGRKNTDSFQKKETAILRLLARSGIPHERITIASVYSDVELFQFWRVPPGAGSPRCQECEEAEKAAKKCPTIMVTGPAGVSMPYDPMTFTATLTGDIPKEPTYRWEVTGGAIIGGQSTSELKAHYIDRWKFTATVIVRGLPPGCPTKASETLHMSGPEPEPEHLGAINNATFTIDKTLLERIGESLTSNESSQLYVWVYVGSSSESQFPSLRSRLLRQLAATKIDPSRFTLKVSSEKARGAIFWRVPPGSDDPTP
jgi:hypothetical protein